MWSAARCAGPASRWGHGHRRDAVFDHPACRQKAHRARRREAGRVREAVTPSTGLAAPVPLSGALASADALVGLVTAPRGGACAINARVATPRWPRRAPAGGGRYPASPSPQKIAAPVPTSSDAHLAARVVQAEHVAGVVQVPLVGRIAAGEPMLAEQDVQDVLPMPVALVGHGDLFALKLASA